MKHTRKPLWRHLLSDTLSLQDYLAGSAPSLADIKRRLLNLERKSQPNLPDHYHRLAVRQETLALPKGSDEHLGDFLIQALMALAQEHLFLDEFQQDGASTAVRVQAPRMNAWQELITTIPPLILQIALLYRTYPISLNADKEEYLAYFKHKLLPNLRYTALPTPRIQQLEDFMRSSQGFHDLHIHLNGTTEADVAWVAFLAHPDEVYAEVAKALQKNLLAKEQFEEAVSSLRESKDLLTLLRCARSLRSYFFYVCYPEQGEEKETLPSCNNPNSPNKPNNLLLDLVNSSRYSSTEDINSPFYSSRTRHPFAALLPSSFLKEEYAMATEGLMHLILFSRIIERKQESLASMYHFYLLILGLANQLIVQQAWQIGFDQFQKITLNDLRAYVEKQSYKARFYQLTGNDYQNPQVKFLEGRFSPKGSEQENLRLIQSIMDSWEEYKKVYPAEDSPELNLTAHFVKRRDKSRAGIRHKELRKELSEKARVLALFRKNQPGLGKVIKGIDAASSEFDTPPEVFAPIFRDLRKSGFRHFTYHAGEDFYHLLGGMQAIYEAINFCDLRAGDRIGHAVAIGLDPDLWSYRLGGSLCLHRGAYLDNLIFAYTLILERGNSSPLLQKTILLLKKRIEELAEEVYGQGFSLRSLQQAWLRRAEDPLAPDSWNKQLESQELVAGKEIEILLWLYHNRRYKYEEIIPVDPLEIFSVEALSELQLLLLACMCEKEIIIETLPSSNVRIGWHSDYSTYHLNRWVQWRKEGKAIPPIVLGTDDPGIFATNIYNEYANIYCNLVNQGMSPTEVMEVVKQLEENARIYRFT